MNALANIKTSLIGTGNRAVMKVRKNSPEICLALGMVSFVGTVVLACKATLRAEEILDRHNDRMEKAKEAADVADVEDDFDIRKEKTNIWAHTVVDFAKLYAPSAALGAVSMACFANVYKTLNGRYIGAVQAFNGVTEAFQAYRNRVIEEEGEEKDRHYRYGTKVEEKEIAEVDENGKETTKKETHETIEQDLSPSEFARFFDESNPNWNPDPHINLMFLRGVRTNMNDVYHTKGHLFLNEVYEALGYSETPAGAVTGWLEGHGPKDVMFGLYDESNQNTRDFINGRSNIVLLDFNICPEVIWDKI